MFLQTLTFVQWHSGELALWRVLLWSIHLVPPSASLLPLLATPPVYAYVGMQFSQLPQGLHNYLHSCPFAFSAFSASFYTQEAPVSHSTLTLKSSSTNNFQGHPSKCLINNSCASTDFICVVSSLSPTPHTGCLSYAGDLIMSRNCGFTSLSLECFISQVHAWCADL